MLRWLPDLFSRRACEYEDEKYGGITHKIGPDQEMCCSEGKTPSGWCEYLDILYQDQKLCGENHRSIDSLGDLQELQINISHGPDPSNFMQTIRAAYSHNFQ